MLKIILIFGILAVVYGDSSVPFPETRIIGGETHDIAQAPYLVSIRYKKNNTAPFEHRCAGTIYSSNIILTTATCLVGLDSKRLHIKAASSYRTQFDGLLYLVDKFIIHPDYNIWFTDNDLALVKLSFNLTADRPKEISPIAIANEVPKAGSVTSIAGWGSTNSSASYDFAEELQITQVSVVEQSKCKAAYGEERITPAMLCAGSERKDACLGDAGGPLVYRGNAVGLVSWGWGCGSSDFPGVYTNLVVFKSWIEAEVEKL